jgi:hypothetical protein
MSNENEIFEIDEGDIEMEDKEQQVEKPTIKKKQKTALSQDRIDKLREQLKLAREAKQKKKNGGKEPIKEEVKEPVSLKVDEPPKPVKKEVKPRVPKTPKVDKNELLLKELQSLKMEIGSLKASKPVQHHTPAPVQHHTPVQHPTQVNHAVSAPIPIPKPVSKKPYSLFKLPDW